MSNRNLSQKTDLYIQYFTDCEQFVTDLDLKGQATKNAKVYFSRFMKRTHIILSKSDLGKAFSHKNNQHRMFTHIYISQTSSSVNLF